MPEAAAQHPWVCAAASGMNSSRRARRIYGALHVKSAGQAMHPRVARRFGLEQSSGTSSNAAQVFSRGSFDSRRSRVFELEVLPVPVHTAPPDTGTSAQPSLVATVAERRSCRRLPARTGAARWRSLSSQPRPPPRPNRSSNSVIVSESRVQSDPKPAKNAKGRPECPRRCAPENRFAL